ncbi:MAG: NAD-dependent malic enzyme, partial [Thermoanaerobaculia bacterium]|nr:NAD-dependent malic enzyme [Thermoanaerobaculia bacterium]
VASRVSAESLASGCLFPPLTEIRQVSAAIATSVAELAYERRLARKPAPQGTTLAEHVREQMYEPVYPMYV